MYTMTPSTGTATLAKDLKVGDRVLIGVDTKGILSVTTKDGFTYLTLALAYGKKGYRTFLATRTLQVY